MLTDITEFSIPAGKVYLNLSKTELGRQMYIAFRDSAKQSHKKKWSFNDSENKIVLVL